MEPDEKILVTVSGGVDSSVMLALFAGAGYNIGVAHCNFQLRGQESEDDEAAVRLQAEKYGVPFYTRRFDTATEMDSTGDSLQMVARRMRYEWFNELCAQHGYGAIAIAHHADDVIETFFINLMRGTGLKGLTSIPRTNGKIIRPLLFASRKEILDYAHAGGIPYREDSSNRSTKYLRNKIRLGIVPVLRDINPKFTELMGENISRITSAQRFIERAMEVVHRHAVAEEDGMIVIDPTKIDAELPLNYVIYELMNNGYGFKGDVVDQVFESLMRGATGKKFYSKDYTAYIDRGRIIISKIEASDTCDTEISADRHRVYCGNSVLLIRHLDIDDIDNLAQPSVTALLDMDKLTFPLRVRRWQEGDSFIPFGMSNHKKVSDYLIDAKVSMAEKARQFVILDGGTGDIVWLVGHRIDNRYRVEKKTENVLKLVKEII